MLLAGLEGAEAALAVGSGMAAITTALMSNLGAGDHVVAQNTHYTATLTLLAEVLPRHGVEVTQVDQTDTEVFEWAMRPNTRVIYTETPTNPTMDLTDLLATAEIAREAGVLTITDNTFASPYNQRPLDLGYDVAVHSATKYLGGHADVTAGAVCGSRHLVERVGARPGARTSLASFRGVAPAAESENLRSEDEVAQRQRTGGRPLFRRTSGRGEGVLSGARLPPPARAGQEADDGWLRGHALLRAQGRLRSRIQDHKAYTGVRPGREPGRGGDAHNSPGFPGLSAQHRRRAACGGDFAGPHIARRRPRGRHLPDRSQPVQARRRSRRVESEKTGQ